MSERGIELPTAIDRLGALTANDYRRVGITRSPAHTYGILRAYPDDNPIRVGFIDRGRLGLELRAVVDEHFLRGVTRHSYLYGRAESGSGKSAVQSMLRDYCRSRGYGFFQVDRRDGGVQLKAWRRFVTHEYHTIEDGGTPRLLCMRAAALCKGQSPPETHGRLVGLPGILAIGSGHHPGRDLGHHVVGYRVYDLDREYPMNEQQIRLLLERTLDAVRCGTDCSVSPSQLTELSRVTGIPGRARDALGLCLAMAALRRSVGNPGVVGAADIAFCSTRSADLHRLLGNSSPTQ